MAAENGRKGGYAAAESKRQTRGLAQFAKMVASGDVSDKNKAHLEKLGIDAEDATNDALIIAGLFQEAVKGKKDAIDKWQELTAVTDKDEERYRIPAECIASSFVDVNREIAPNIAYVFEGGRGSTKSSFISLKLIELIKNNPQLHACVVRSVAATLKDSVFAQVQWAINELGLEKEFKTTKSPLEMTYIKTGQKIYFRGCDDPMKLKGIKPPFGYVGILWKEEKDQLKGPEEERSINQSVLRGGNITYDFSSYNPPKSASNWVNRIKLEPNDKRVIHTSDYRSVPAAWLGQKFIDDAEHLKEVNPNAYDHEYLGIPNGEGGNVFDNVEVRTITNEEMSHFDTIYQGLDFGWYPDPLAFIRVAYYPAQEAIYLLDELYVNKWSNAKVAEWISEHNYDDYEIICDSAEPKSINDFRDLGLPARPAIKGPGSIEYGFKWLQVRKIVIDAQRTPNAYNEIINYEYERDKNDNVISGYPDANNHLIDALRYSLERFYNKRGNNA